MSREALSLEISQVVSRVVSGDAIDVAEQSVMLALKYPDLGMSGEMIGEAIVRAANMVGMIKSAPAPVSWPDASVAAKTPKMPVAAGIAMPSRSAEMSALDRSMEDELASAIDAEIGSLVAERTASPAANLRASSGPPTKAARPGPFAALRSLFRS
jgi:hypothetical protein